MLFTATIYAYDALSTVQITAEVRLHTGTGETGSEAVLRATTAIPGVGEGDPRNWLEDVLVGLLEAL